MACCLTLGSRDLFSAGLLSKTSMAACPGAAAWRMKRNQAWKLSAWAREGDMPTSGELGSAQQEAAEAPDCAMHITLVPSTIRKSQGAWEAGRRGARHLMREEGLENADWQAGAR